MWLFNKLKMWNRKGAWIEFPIVPKQIEKGQKYILILKNKHIDLVIKIRLLLRDVRKLTEALNECYSTIAALEGGNNQLQFCVKALETKLGALKTAMGCDKCAALRLRIKQLENILNIGEIGILKADVNQPSIKAFNKSCKDAVKEWENLHEEINVLGTEIAGEER